MSDQKQFYNPYAFIPFPNKAKQQDSYESIQAGNSTASQHKWHKNTLSGAIFLSIKNHTKLVVGGKKDENGVVKFFRNHSTDELSIPANSIRGMITSTAEILSNSAARVLENQRYSVRSDPEERGDALSAIGLLHQDEKQWFIEPIAVGNVTGKRDKYNPKKYNFYPNSVKLNSDCKKLQWKDYLKWNLHSYEDNNGCLQVKKEHCELVFQVDCFHGKDPTYLYIKNNKVPHVSLREKFYTIADYSFGIYRCCDKDEFAFLNGLLFKEGRDLLTESQMEAEKIPLDDPGFDRVLPFFINAKGREEQFVSTKKYEYLLPYSDKKEKKRVRIPIDDEVIESLQSRLKKVCRFDAKGDYIGTYIIPKGWDRIKGENVDKVMSGDLVYYSSEAGKINHLSYSSIWKKDTKLKNTDEYFKQSNLSTSLPWGRRGEDTRLSPVEQIFGTVEVTEDNRTSRNLASRVRFYDGYLIRDYAKNDLSEENLPVLRNPKPPCPSMYFSDVGSVGKSGLRAAFANSYSAVPNGRKRYLVHSSSAIEVDENVKAETLKPCKESSFGTWVEFDNLLPEELDLLLASTGAREYCGNTHKAFKEAKLFKQQLGMGKPHGYGQVELKICGVLLKHSAKDDNSRYKSLNDSSYLFTHYFEGYEPDMEFYSVLGNCVGFSFSETISSDIESLLPPINSPSLVSKEAYNKLLILNNFSDESLPVHYPKKEEGDGKIFEWFVENDKASNPQSLGAISNRVEPLEKN